MANICWWYYISKFTEFFDTLFFILRKKTQHVSTLHVIHHGCMPFSVWLGLKFAPGKFAKPHHYLTEPLPPRHELIQYLQLLISFQVATVPSLPCWTHLYILLCISTTWSLPWDPNIRNTSGGRSIWPLSKWYESLLFTGVCHLPVEFNFVFVLILF